MNDKQQLAAMGTQYRLTEEQAKGLAERMPQTGALQVIDDEPLCMAKRIEELEAQVLALESSLLAAKRSWPDKCPITRRDFFMEIDGVPTYGGPYDSYTIPEMLGTPEQPWHDRELFVRRFDHDRGHWVDDEIIDLRVIHDGVLDDLIGDQVPEGWELVPVEPTPEMILAGIDAQAEKLKRYALGGSLHPIGHGMPDAYSAMLAATPSPDGTK